MGYQTTIVILNDELHRLENDPDFADKLVRAIRSGESGALETLRGVTIAGTSHSGDTAVYRVGGNRVHRMGGTGDHANSDAAVVEELARRHGLTVARLPAAGEPPPAFACGDPVEWGGSHGTRTVRRGTVVVVVPAHQKPISPVEAKAQGYTSLYSADAPTRDHASYLVAEARGATGTRTLRWPRVGALRAPVA